MRQQCPDDVRAIDQITGLMFRIYREGSGFSLTDVAEHLEIDPDDLQAHEEGRIPLETARLYHAGILFGVKISAFFQPYYYPELFDDQG